MTNLSETELQEIEKRLKFAIKNGHAGSVGYILIERHIPALLSTVREQRELIEEQRRTIQALMMGVEEHTGKEGTTPVLRYIEELERQVQERWIPIEKQHPEEEGRYFILYSHKGQPPKPFVADLSFDGLGWAWSGFINDDNRVTHWMPIPEQTP